LKKRDIFIYLIYLYREFHYVLCINFVFVWHWRLTLASCLLGRWLCHLSHYTSPF
jgi:hypothetical protein